MSRGRVLLVALAAAAVAQPCLADEDDWPVLKGARVDDAPPALALAIYRAKGPTFGLGVYPKQDAQGPYLLARYVSAENGAATIAWTSSRTCPVLNRVLARVEKVPAPRLMAPGAAPAPAGRREDSSYLFWSVDARWPGATGSAGLELRATGGPMAAWADSAARALAPCWTPARP